MGGLRTGYPDRFDVNENLISTLADLDALIASCKMTAGQRRVVDLLMKGHSFAEIACISGRDSDSVRDQFDRAVRCINVQNSAAWAACCKRRMDMD